MPFFGSSSSAGQSAWEADVETATAIDKTVEMLYASQFTVIDKLKSSGTAERRDLTKAIMKRASRDAGSFAGCVQFIDTLLNNAGKPMQLELSTREVCEELFRLGMKFKNDNQYINTALGLFRKWSHTKELREDGQLDLIVRLYKRFKQEGLVAERSRHRAADSYNQSEAKPPTTETASSRAEASENARFEEDMKMALQLSLEEEKRRKTTTPQPRSLYGSLPVTVDSPVAAPVLQSTAVAPSAPPGKAIVTASFDFESAEKDELSFRTGDQITLLDDSDKCWWKGRLGNREGFFPALFVTKDTPASAPNDLKAKQSAASVQPQTSSNVAPVPAGPRRLDVARIQRCLELQSAADVEQVSDPDGERELSALEADCAAMTDSLTTELELCDRRLNEIGLLESDYNMAYELYTHVLKEQQERETARRVAAAQYAGWQQQQAAAAQQQAAAAQQQAAAWYSQQSQAAGYYPPPNVPYGAPPPVGAYATGLYAQPQAAAPIAYPAASYQPNHAGQTQPGFQPYPDASQSTAYRPVTNASLNAFYEQATLPYPAP